MADISTKLQLARWLGGSSSSDTVDARAAVPVTGIATADSSNGAVSVLIGVPDETTTAEDLTATIPIIGTAKEGDEVIINVANSIPVAAGVIGGGDEIAESIQVLATDLNDSISAAYKQMQAYSDDLAAADAALAANVSANSASIDEIKRYFRIVIDQESNIPYVLIGEDSSDFKLSVSDRQIGFSVGNTTTSYMNTERFYIHTADITDMLYIGDFAWIKRSNGNLSLKHMG